MNKFLMFPLLLLCAAAVPKGVSAQDEWDDGYGDEQASDEWIENDGSEEADEPDAFDLKPLLESAIEAEKAELAESEDAAHNKRLALSLGSLEGLSKIRSALSAYYEDEEKYPESLSALRPKYLKKVPTLHLPGTKHKSTEAIRVIARLNNGDDLASELKDSGRWTYVADPESRLFGAFFIDCSHTDSRGNGWDAY